MKNNIIKLAQVAIAITFLLSACKPEKEETIITESYNGVFIVNEGGFGKSNGSVGLYKPGTGEYAETFEKVNGRPLGDVVQSMTLINGKFYIIVNNSNKIEVVNQSDFKSVTTITVSQPRSIIKVSDSKAYISQMNGTSMSVLDLGNNTISKTIDVKAATDNMVLMNNIVYVSKAYADKLYLINAGSDAVTDSIVAGNGVGSLVNIGTTKIGIFCLGVVDFNNGNVIENGKIVIVNKDSNKVERIIPLTTGSFGGAMVSNSTSLFYTFGDGKLYRVLNSATVAASSPMLTISGSIYGVNIDPLNDDIYIMDAGAFSSAGKVFIYNNTGVLQKQFTVGIGPSRAVFNY